jgi:hypothetical protein
MIRRQRPDSPVRREKQQKTAIQALPRPNANLQVVDFIVVRREFRYAAEQRNLAADKGNYWQNSGTAAEFVCLQDFLTGRSSHAAAGV